VKVTVKQDAITDKISEMFDYNFNGTTEFVPHEISAIDRETILKDFSIGLIVGNHDNIKLLSQWFSEVMLWRDFSEFGLLLTHVPVHQSTLKENHRFGDGSMVNVHGHIHQNASPVGPYKCVCVEQTNYTPVNIDELRAN
jgi:calcineurin-like phosphoesterase family protein